MEYVSRVLFDIDGRSIEDFKSVTEKEVELNKAVNLMNKTGFMAVTPRYGVEVEYAVPESGPEFDFRSIKDGRLSIEFLNGKRITYTGVHVLTIGDLTIDGENEATKTVSFGAANRVEE